MKKITTLLAACLVTSAGFAQSDRVWEGVQEQKVWDYSTANWVDPDFDILPTTFSAGDNAIFNDKVTEGAETVTLGSEISASGILFSSSKDIKITDGGNTDYLISGNGSLVIDGTGTLTLNVKNNLTGGTIVNNGKVAMEKQNSPNVFGEKLVLNGGIANFATTSSSSYPSITLPVEIPNGVTASVELSRYSYWSSPITGGGDLTIFAGGERVYLGQKNVQPDWSAFTGNVKVERYVMEGVNPGWYGLVLNTNKTFDYESFTGIDSTFHNRKLHLGSNTQIGAESGTRAYAIGEITSEDESVLFGCYYRGDSEGPSIYYIVGGLNTDVVFPGRMASNGVKNYNKFGIIKIGSGTYTFTNNYNFLTKTGLEVREGKVLISNDLNLRNNSHGGIGGLTYVRENGIFGGIGRTGGNVDVYGKLEPGLNWQKGVLMIVDSLQIEPGTLNSKKDLTLHAGSVAEFDIHSTGSYDQVEVYGNVSFKSDGTGKPTLKITIPGAYEINDGDQFEIISAYTCNDETIDFDIEYPSITGVTWSYEIVRLEDEVDNANARIPEGAALKFKVVVKATGSASGIESAPSVSDIVTVYPNPTYGEVKVSASDVEISSVEVYNLQGQLVKTQAANGSETTLQISEIPSGVYFVKVYTANGVVVQKLVKK